MAARTLDNCSLVQRMIKTGVGEPEQYHNINRCLGYQRSENDDEPCEKCKRCKYNISFNEE